MPDEQASAWPSGSLTHEGRLASPGVPSHHHHAGHAASCTIDCPVERFDLDGAAHKGGICSHAHQPRSGREIGLVEEVYSCPAALIWHRLDGIAGSVAPTSP
jgi:hypothetical protein